MKKIRERLKSIRLKFSLLWRSWNKRKTAQALYFPLTFGAAVLVMSYFTGAVFAGVYMFTSLVHEMGHYIAASMLGRDAWLPVWIPLGKITWAGTRVQGYDPETDRIISLWGPIAGVGACLLVMIGAAIAKQPPIMWAGFWIMWVHVFNGTLGGDGRRHYHSTVKWRESMDDMAYASA